MDIEDFPRVQRKDLSMVECPFLNCEYKGEILPCYLTHKHIDCPEFRRQYDLSIPPTLESIRRFDHS